MLLLLFIILSFMLLPLFFFNETKLQKTKEKKLIEDIDQILPQTQCGDCGYPACLPYATAIAKNECDINQCPPGGYLSIQALAHLLGREAKPLNKNYGTEKPLTLALIDEEICIGCLKCIKVCPVDAIIGAEKQMHSIIHERCTGCELCVPPCPVDCISMEKAPYDLRDWHWAKPENVIRR